jgi:hypothetical protein
VERAVIPTAAMMGVTMILRVNKVRALANMNVELVIKLRRSTCSGRSEILENRQEKLEIEQKSSDFRDFLTTLEFGNSEDQFSNLATAKLSGTRLPGMV